MRFRLALGFSFPCAKGANVADTVDKMCWFQGKSTEKHGFHQIYRFEPKKNRIYSRCLEPPIPKKDPQGACQ